MLKLILACHKHPGYNPSKGPNAIKGGCEFCFKLLKIGCEIASLKRAGQNGAWKAAGQELRIPLVLAYRSKVSQKTMAMPQDDEQPMLFAVEESAPLRESLEPKPRPAKRRAARG
jgi:hypothetical protein